MPTSRSVERRRFLQHALAGAGVTAVLPAMNSLNLLAATRRAPASRGRGGYGPLVPAADLRDGVERIALPEGFQYRSFSGAATDVRRQSRAARARRHGRVQHAGRQVPARPQSRGPQQPRRRHDGDRRQRVRREGRRRHDDTRRESVHARARARLHQPQRHDRQLRRRRDAVGLVDHVRRDERGTPSGWLKQHGYCFDVPAAARMRRCRRWPCRTWAASRTRPSRSIRTRGSSTRPRTTAAAQGSRAQRLLPIPAEHAGRPERRRHVCRCWRSRAGSSTTRAAIRPIGVALPVDVGGHRQSESGRDVVHGRVQPGTGTRRRALPAARGVLVGQRRRLLRRHQRRQRRASAPCGSSGRRATAAR